MTKKIFKEIYLRHLLGNCEKEWRSIKYSLRSKWSYVY